MDEKKRNTPGYDEHGWPLYNFAWFFREVFLPFLVLLAVIVILGAIL